MFVLTSVTLSEERDEKKQVTSWQSLCTKKKLYFCLTVLLVFVKLIVCVHDGTVCLSAFSCFTQKFSCNQGLEDLFKLKIKVICVPLDGLAPGFLRSLCIILLLLCHRWRVLRARQQTNSVRHFLKCGLERCWSTLPTVWPQRIVFNLNSGAQTLPWVDLEGLLLSRTTICMAGAIFVHYSIKSASGQAWVCIFVEETSLLT